MTVRHNLGTADLADGSMRGHELSSGQRICLARLGSAWFAIDDVCNHAGCILSAGRIEGHEVICPCHAMTFDVRTGALTCRPRLCEDQRAFRVESVDGELWVVVE
jgi:3-phenylpropionate/trans-cinnamate dioxygenase ferredoxin subunit